MEDFRELANSAPVLIWQNDASGMVFMNEEYVRFVGKPADELRGMGWASALHPDSDDYVRDYQRAFQRRERFESHFRFLRHDGQYRWLKTVGLPYFSGDQFIGYVGCSFDVTEIKQAEVALRDQQAWFTKVADAVPTITWVTDADGVCTFASHRWYQVTGLPPGAALGERWLDAIHPDDRDEVAALFRRAIHRRDGFGTEYRLRQADGSFRWYFSAGAPMYDDATNFIGHAGTAIDITQRKLAEIERERAAQALREAAARKDEFIALLAHELRNPLAPINTAADLLRLQPDSSQQVQKLTAVIQRQVGHMARLIDDLLDVARVASGRLEIKRRPCNLAELVREVAQDYAPTLAQAGGHTELDVPAEALLVDADPVRVAQALRNYLQNTLRFAPGARVRVRAYREGTNAVVQVVDDGPGVPGDLLPHLFQPFSQGAQDAGRSKGGLGLGLVMTKGIIEMHGGTVAGRSDGLGAGATFEFTLPLMRR